MKKILTLIILLTFTIIIPVKADTITTFSINEIASSPGEHITVKVNMDNKQEFGVLTVRVHYDNTKLEYISDTINGLKATLRGTDKKTDKGLVVLYGINLNGKSTMKDTGKILTIEFKIKEDVTEDIPIQLEIKDFGKDDTNKLKYETKNGIIKIKKDIETVTKDKKDNLQEELEAKIKSDTKEGENKDESKDETITWSSTDEKVATVDEKGNVEFKTDGNVTIEAKDKDGKVVYSKDYFIKDKVKKKYPIKTIIGVSIIILLIGIIIWRKKCQKRK